MLFSVRSYISTSFSFIAIVICLNATFPSFSGAADAPEGYPWPIRAPHYISSTFGERRAGRFHLGLDFKSGGMIGKEVIALDDGYISRVRTSPFGYGKALYMMLDSGKIVVYGHLSGFLPEIEDELFTMRIRKGSYDIDWYPAPNKYRITKGQVVAYSGDSGSGPAHLHIEIRDMNNVPENPLNYGFEVRDTVPPVIKSVAIIPFDSASLVDGFPVTQWLDASITRDDPFILSGSIGISVDTYDRVTATPNILGVYHAELAVDSTVVFSKTYDRISYDHDRYGAFDHMPGVLNGGNGYLTALYRQIGNDLDIYRGDGILTAEKLTPGKRYVITVRAGDHAGNSTEYSFPVMFGARPFFTVCECTVPGKIHIAGRHLTGSVESVTIQGLSADGVRLTEQTIPVSRNLFDIQTDLDSDAARTYRVVLVSDDGIESLPAVVRSHKGISGGDDSPPDIDTFLLNDRLVIRVRSDEIPSSIPALRIAGIGESDALMCMMPESGRSWITAVPYPDAGTYNLTIAASALAYGGIPAERTVKTSFTVIPANRKTLVTSPDSLFTLTVTPESLYRPSAVTVGQADVRASNGLRMVSGGYHINWGDYPLRGHCDIGLRINGDIPEKSALYMTGNGNGNGWRFVSDLRNGDEFSGTVAGSGYMAVLTDLHPPYLAASEPRPGSTVRSNRPRLVARLEDRGSGIGGSDSIVMQIDGIRIYGEYDYEADRISYVPHNPLDPGKHTVEVTAVDLMGNEKTISWSFTVSQ